MQIINQMINDLMDFEKQYNLMIFMFILLKVKKYSDGALDHVFNKISLVFNLLFPKLNLIISSVFDNQFVFDLTKSLIVFSGVSIVLFIIILLSQIFIDDYLGVNVSFEGRQYNVDLLLAKCGIIPINIYIFIFLIILIFFDDFEIKIYQPEKLIEVLGFYISLVFDSLVIVGIFLEGKSNKNKTSSS